MKKGFLLGLRNKKVDAKKFAPVKVRRSAIRTSRATSVPAEILDDIFRYLDRNELEKCQLVCLLWNYYVEENGVSLAYRILEALEFEDDGFIRIPVNMRGIEIVDVAKVLRYSFIEHCQISFFNEYVYRAFRELKEKMDKPLSINNFMVGYINDHREFPYCFKLLDVTVKNFVQAVETRLIFCAYQLGYLVSRLDLLNIPQPTRIIFEVDNSQGIYESEIQPIINYLFHPNLTNKSNRCCFILDSLTVGADFVQKICEKFLVYPHLEAVFKTIEVLPRISTIVHGKRYLKQKGYKKLKGKIESDHTTWLDFNHPYVVERLDGWCLLICLQNVPDAVIEGEEYNLTFFVRKKEDFIK